MKEGEDPGLSQGANRATFPDKGLGIVRAMSQEEQRTYISEFLASSEIRVHEKPYILEPRSIVRLVFPAHAVKVALFDYEMELGDIHVPHGLVANVEVQADDIEEAIKRCEASVSMALCICSCVARSSIGIPRIQWIYDGTGHEVRERDFIVWTYDSSIPWGKRKLNTDHLFSWFDRYSMIQLLVS